MSILFVALWTTSAGVCAGGVTRHLLALLRRGARVRAPVCELATGLLWGLAGAGAAARVVPPPWLPAVLGLGWFGVAASVVDVVHHRLPDALTLPALPVAFVLLGPLGGAALLRAVVGAVLAALVHAAVHVVAPRGLGGGDVKLSAPLGAVLAAASWSALAAAAVLAAVLTVLVLAVAAVRARLRGGSVPVAVAHGPSMLAATWVVVVIGGAVGGAVGGAASGIGTA